MQPTIEIEFGDRSKRLGKRRNHKAEYALLEQILINPFPIQFEEEPLREPPEYTGWTYFNLEKLHPTEPIADYELGKSLALVEKIVLLAWEVGYEGHRIQPSGLFLAQNFVARGVARCAQELNWPGSHNSLTYQQARTALHYWRFRKPDTNANLWLPTSPP